VVILLHGAATVIEAMGAGRKAAKGIDDYLTSGSGSMIIVDAYHDTHLHSIPSSSDLHRIIMPRKKHTRK
jgi:hypothetical protein